MWWRVIGGIAAWIALTLAISELGERVHTFVTRRRRRRLEAI